MFSLHRRRGGAAEKKERKDWDARESRPCRLERTVEHAMRALDGGAGMMAREELNQAKAVLGSSEAVSTSRRRPR